MFEIGYPVLVPTGYGLIQDIQLVNGKYIYTVLLANMTKIKIEKKLVKPVIENQKISMIDINKSLMLIQSACNTVDDVIVNNATTGNITSDLTYAIQQLETAKNYLGESK